MKVFFVLLSLLACTLLVHATVAVLYTNQSGTQDGYIDCTMAGCAAGGITRDNTSTTFKVGGTVAASPFDRGFMDFNTTTIPSSATLSNLTLTINVTATQNCNTGVNQTNLTKLVVPASNNTNNNGGNTNLFNYIGNGSVYVTSMNFNTTGLLTLSLGSSAQTDFSNQLSAGWFSIGFLGTEGCVAGAGAPTESSVATTEYGDANGKPYLTVTYTTSSDTAPPQYYSNSTNTTQNGTSVLFSLNWTDDTNVSGYIFSFDNGTGSFTNDSFVSFSGASNWSNVTKFVNQTNNTKIRWQVYANDTSNNWNSTSIFSFLTSAPVVDTTPPFYFSNSTNTTQNGTSVLFSLNWTDSDGGMSGYIFSFDNGTGSFANDSFASLSGTSTWSNVTKFVNSTNNSKIRWQIYANDTSNNWNSSAIFSFFTSATDTVAPTFSSNSTNSTANGTSVLFSLYTSDDFSLSGYIFSFDNGTGSFANDSFVQLTGGANWSNATKFVNVTNGVKIRWQVYANDTANLWASSSIYSFTTSAPLPVSNVTLYSVGTPAIAPNPADNSTWLNCSATFADTSRTSMSYSFEWYVNNALNSSLSATANSVSNYTSAYAPTGVAPTLLHAGDVWICSAMASDGTNSSNWYNSTPVQIVSNASLGINRMLMSCPQLILNNSASITVSYYQAATLTCKNINVTAAYSNGTLLPSSYIGAQNCLPGSKAQYSISFGGSDNYTITASSGALSTACSITYRQISLLPSRVPDFNLLLLPLFVAASLLVLRRGQKIRRE